MSTNLQKTRAAEGDDDANKTEEQPGPSSAFQVIPQETHHSDNSSDQSSSVVGIGDVKGRNVSRERPPLEKRENKRPRISDENEQGSEVHMDTDCSSNEEDLVDGDEDVEEEGNDLERNVMDIDSDQPESLPVQDTTAAKASQPSRRSSSNAEENVSNTMQSSSLRARPSISRDPVSFRYQMDAAIASTSAAAMAPPLSRLMEDSPILDEVYNLPVRGETGRRRSATPGVAGGIPNVEPSFRRHAGGDVDLNENKGQAGPFQHDKVHGAQGFMWTRKLFFLSTELVFPGFTAYSDSKDRKADYMGGVRIRSSCMMQALLYADSMFFVAWTLSFLSTSDILITVLKELHGYLSICLTCLFIVVNILRLRFGLKGNEHDEVQYLALFWMTTVIVQIPLFAFIFLTDLFCPVLLAFTVTMDGVMMVFILLESIVGFIHFRSLLRDELNILRMARRSNEASQSRADLQNAGPSAAVFPISGSSSNLMDLARGLPHQDDSSSEDQVENEPFGRETMDFQMHIRHLSETHGHGRGQAEEEQESEDSNSDSSEQVTSTSDTVRRRPIIAN